MGKRFDLRLKFEKSHLEKYFYGEKFSIETVKGTRVVERRITINGNKEYGLRIYISENYPEECPQLVVFDSPEKMPDWQGSHTTHTWPKKDGFVQICFYRHSCWSKDNKLYQVFNKGEEWLEAYEEHISNGKQMCEILPEMEPSEEEKALTKALLCFEIVFIPSAIVRHQLWNRIIPSLAGRALMEPSLEGRALMEHSHDGRALMGPSHEGRALTGPSLEGRALMGLSLEKEGFMEQMLRMWRSIWS